MNRNPKKVIDRAKFVQREVKKAKNPTKTVKRLADMLFVSESTVWRDLRRDI